MKTTVRWLLFEYKGSELVILSKPFKTKKLAEKARLKYPDRRPKKDSNRRRSRANPVANPGITDFSVLHQRQDSINLIHG